MKIPQLSFETIENCGLFNKRAKGNGMVAKWAARNERGECRSFGGTRKRDVWLMREGIVNDRIFRNGC